MRMGLLKDNGNGDKIAKSKKILQQYRQNREQILNDIDPSLAMAIMSVTEKLLKLKS